MTEHEPTAPGIVDEIGTFDADDPDHILMRRVAEDVEDHGEVHASFVGEDAEVELRLGTLRVDYDSKTFEVWDGDHYQSYTVRQLSSRYKPMDPTH